MPDRAPKRQCPRERRRRRGDALTADLAHDLAVEERAYPTPQPSARPSMIVETELYLAPRTWLRPAVERSGRSVSISVGPLRVHVVR